MPASRSCQPVLWLALVLGAIVVAGCSATTLPSGGGASGGGSAAASVTASGGANDLAAAQSYCTQKGGMLVPRIATANTNGDPSTWLQLAGRWTLCEFESGTSDSTTRISVDPITLYSPKPTLAGLAYLSKLPTPNPPQVGQNPAGYNCLENLLGTDAFGNAAGGSGGWVDQSQPVFVVMNLCMFADGSAIDEFGIWYYANGTVRGVDLAPLMRYQPGSQGLPEVFVRQAR